MAGQARHDKHLCKTVTYLFISYFICIFYLILFQIIIEETFNFIKRNFLQIIIQFGMISDRNNQ